MACVEIRGRLVWRIIRIEPAVNTCVYLRYAPKKVWRIVLHWQPLVELVLVVHDEPSVFPVVTTFDVLVERNGVMAVGNDGVPDTTPVVIQRIRWLHSVPFCNPVGKFGLE